MIVDETDPCGDVLEGPHVAARLGADLPGPFRCSFSRRHRGAHHDLADPSRDVWWWTWGNGRSQIRAKVRGEPRVRI